MQMSQFAWTTFSSLPVTEKTKSNYGGAFRRYVEPFLGQRDIASITRGDIQGVLAPLSPPSAQQTLMMLKMLFREAEIQGLVTDRPTDHVRTERVVVRPKRFLTWEFMQTVHFGRYDNQIRFLALHGLRWGEAVVLTPSDIHEGRVWINRSVHGRTKSAAGVRSVPYLGHFEPFPRDRRSLARVLTPHGVTIHSLRKTYAYLLKRSGVHVSTAQRLLGHSSPTVTLAVYTQVLDDEIDEAGQILLSRIGGPAATGS